MQLPTPDDVLNHTTGVAAAVLTELAQRLSDPQVTANSQYGHLSDPYWCFSFQGTATRHDKATISAALIRKGWHRVEVTNSEEGGERPGLVGVKMYSRAEQVAPPEGYVTAKIVETEQCTPGDTWSPGEINDTHTPLLHTDLSHGWVAIQKYFAPLRTEESWIILSDISTGQRIKVLLTPATTQ